MNSARSVPCCKRTFKVGVRWESRVRARVRVTVRIRLGVRIRVRVEEVLDNEGGAIIAETQDRHVVLCRRYIFCYGKMIKRYF
jgi:hypothetical protein